jgi:hypothetical protein
MQRNDIAVAVSRTDLFDFLVRGLAAITPCRWQALICSASLNTTQAALAVRVKRGIEDPRQAGRSSAIKSSALLPLAYQRVWHIGQRTSIPSMLGTQPCATANVVTLMMLTLLCRSTFCRGKSELMIPSATPANHVSQCFDCQSLLTAGICKQHQPAHSLALQMRLHETPCWNSDIAHVAVREFLLESLC